ncbi:hypothetical protein [Spirosoma arcticum]
MKQRLILLSLLVLTITTSYAQKLWTEAVRRNTVDNLKRTRDELTRETEQLTDAQWLSLPFSGHKSRILWAFLTKACTSTVTTFLFSASTEPTALRTWISTGSTPVSANSWALRR